MIWAKFSGPGLGQFWVQLPHRDNLQGEEFAKGIVVGFGLVSRDQFQLVDMRYSPHPTEPLRELEKVREFYQQFYEKD